LCRLIASIVLTRVRSCFGEKNETGCRGDGVWDAGDWGSFRDEYGFAEGRGGKGDVPGVDQCGGSEARDGSFSAGDEGGAEKEFLLFRILPGAGDFEWVDPEGKRQVGFWGENVGRDPFANSTVDITVPVPTNATFFELTGARSWIERRWDNVSLPFSLPSAEFRFEPPLVRSPAVDTR
jgi:hypothetical protein